MNEDVAYARNTESGCKRARRKRLAMENPALSLSLDRDQILVLFFVTNSYVFVVLNDIRVIDISASSAACSLLRVGNYEFTAAINDKCLTSQSARTVSAIF